MPLFGMEQEQNHPTWKIPQTREEYLSRIAVGPFLVKLLCDMNGIPIEKESFDRKHTARHTGKRRNDWHGAQIVGIFCNQICCCTSLFSVIGRHHLFTFEIGVKLRHSNHSCITSSTVVLVYLLN